MIAGRNAAANDAPVAALNAFGAALRRFAVLGDRAGEASALAHIGETEELLGRFPAALDAARRAAALHRAVGAERDATGDLVDAGIVEDDLGRYADALRDEFRALARAVATGDDFHAAGALGTLGVVEMHLGRLEPALRDHTRSLALDRKLGNRLGQGDELGRIALVLEQAGRYPEANRDLDAALAIHRAIRNRRGEAKTHNNLGIVDEHLGRYIAALAEYDAALPLFERIGNRLGAAEVLGNIGVIDEDLGRYLPALRAQQQAFAVFHELANPLGEGDDLANTAIVDNDLGRYDESLRALDRALAVDRAIGNAFGEANARESVGNVYEDLGRFEDALREFQAALAIHRRLRSLRGEAGDLGDIGIVLADLGRGPDAIVAQSAAFDIDRTLANPVGEAADLNNVGNLEERAGNARGALREHMRALALDRTTGNRLGEAADLANVGNDRNLLGDGAAALLNARASLEAERGLGAPESVWRARRVEARADASLDRRDEAIVAYDAAIEGIESVRASLDAVSERRTYFENKVFVYDEFVDYLRDLDRRYPDAGYDRKALEIFEREQGRAFLEEIGASSARRFSGVPAEVTARESELAQAADRVETLLAAARAATAPDPTAIGSLEREYSGIERTRAGLESRIRVAYPAYYALTHPQPADPRDFQQLLGPGDVALVYAVLDDATALWVIDRSHLTLLTLPAGAKDVSAMIDAVARGPRIVADAIADHAGPGQILRRSQTALPEISAGSFALYQFLVPPAARASVEGATNLLVIPTGPLYRLPWELLVTENPRDAAEPHYLIDDRAVSYLSSISLLGLLRTAASAHRARPYEVLAFADPRYDSDATPAPAGIAETRSVDRLRANVLASYIGRGPQQSFDPLPGTATEAHAVVAALDPPARSHPLYEGEDASRANLLRLQDADCAAGPCLRDYRYILFATHGVLPDEVEGLLQPALVLAHPERGEGFLTMGDVLGLTLDADVVSLSACNTGRGIVTRGDGVRGLTQAFMYAGTPVVAVTLWESSELAAPRLTPAFYRGLHAGDSPAQALRAAKRELLHGDDPLLRLPYFWAPTIVFGDGASAARPS
jgi:CHAT domain-containing protein/tetratricopeptide (TPR) repeat protein